ncbi:MAG: ribonuclease D, partial [Acinetobacter sp.]
GEEKEVKRDVLGWSYDILTKPLVTLLRQDIEYLATQMKSAK